MLCSGKRWGLRPAGEPLQGRSPVAVTSGWHVAPEIATSAAVAKPFVPSVPQLEEQRGHTPVQ